LLIALTAVAVAVRSVGLNSGLWYDEIRTLLDSVHSPLWRILTVYPGDNQHTLFSVLAHVSIAVFGDQAWSLRLPSMLLGAATVPVLFFFAREFTGRAEALLASLLLTFSYHHVWFSQSARGYAALALFTLLSSWLLMRALRSRRPGDFVWYAIAAALGVYTHVTMVFLVVSHAVLCALPLGLPGLTDERVQRWRLPAMGFALAALFSLLLYSPVLFDVQRFVVQQASPMRGATPAWAVAELLRGLQIGLGSAVGLLVGAALFAAGVWSYIRQSKFLIGMFLLPGVITLAATVALHRPIRPRFVMFLAGFGVLIVVRGALEIGRLLQRKMPANALTVPPQGIALVVLMALLSAASLRGLYRYPKQDFVGAMKYVELHAAADEPVLAAGGAGYPYQEYFHRPWERVASRSQLQDIHTRGKRVWVIYTMKSYIATDLMQTLAEDCVEPKVFPGTLSDGEVTVCHMLP
jgi:uncharacterized membrane protein